MTSARSVTCVWVVLGTLAAASPAAGQWGQFRGPNGSGVAADTGYPAIFSPTSHVVWKAAVPYGQSSPVVVGSRLYMTATEGDRLLTICLDAATGRERWRRAIPRPRPTAIFRANDPASPTPVADGQGVVVFFADFGLAAYTPDGQDRWTLPLGPFTSFYGMAASPIIAGNLLVMVCDQSRGSFAIAVDRANGEERWRRERPAATESWATPMVFRPAGEAGEAQLVMVSSTRLDAYALDTGEPRWWMPVASSGAIGTAVAHGDTLVVSTLASNEPWMEAFEAVLAKFDANKDGRLSRQEFTDPELAEHFGWVDADGDDVIVAAEWNAARSWGVGEYGIAAIRPGAQRGRIEPAAALWRFKKNLPFIPSPLVYQDVVYLVKSGGIITAIDPATGLATKEGRSREAPGDYQASPIAVEDKVFLASVNGKITVLKAGRQWELLGVNDLGDEIHATPALAGGRIYVRTRGTLYCFGGDKS